MLDELGPLSRRLMGNGYFSSGCRLTASNKAWPGVRLTLTNAGLSNLRKLSRNLPCHFALGRNRNHQCLAAAIVNALGEEFGVKITVKRGIQNTSNKLMAEQ